MAVPRLEADVCGPVWVTGRESPRNLSAWEAEEPASGKGFKFETRHILKKTAQTRHV